MNLRTDLACEAYELHKENIKDGIFQTDFNVSGIDFVKVDVTSEAASKQIGKPCGSYITAFVSSLLDGNSDLVTAAEAVANEIKKLLPDNSSPVLVAGLGNRDITPDALGPKVADRILATRHLSSNSDTAYFRPVCAIAPGVLAQTGIETSEIISCISSEVSPCAVILIDALASKSAQRLGNTVQLSDSGISPGSGVFNSRKEISASSLGVKVISIGVPTVVDAATLAFDLLNEEERTEQLQSKFKLNGQSLMITPREIDVILKRSSELISLAINKALHPDLDTDEILFLLS